MSLEPWSEERPVEASPFEDRTLPAASGVPPSQLRLTLERIGIGFVAIISLLVPLVIGLLFYLAVSDGLVINANDPLHEIRLWMVQERRGATGIGLTITTPAAGNGAAQCAYTSVTFLKWDRQLRIERNSDYCRCYEYKGGQLVDSDTITCR